MVFLLFLIYVYSMASPQKKDLQGYISDVTPSKLSSKRNSYFDVNLQTSPHTYSKVRVMENQNTKRLLFLKGKEEKSAINFKNLSPSKNLAFFNSNSGSRIEYLSEINFKFSENEINTKVNTINDEMIGCVILITGCIKWTNEEKVIIANGTEKKVRDGVFGDEFGTIPISIWEENIAKLDEEKCFKISKVLVSKYLSSLKLQTTSSSEVLATDEDVHVKWDNHDKVADVVSRKTVNGKIISCNIETYKSCVRSTCNKKVFPLLGEKMVNCSNCNSKMLVDFCKISRKLSLLVEEEDHTQVNLVGFENVLKDIANEREVIDEEYFLQMGNISIELNNQNIITKFLDS